MTQLINYLIFLPTATALHAARNSADAPPPYTEQPAPFNTPVLTFAGEVTLNEFRIPNVDAAIPVSMKLDEMQVYMQQDEIPALVHVTHEHGQRMAVVKGLFSVTDEGLKVRGQDSDYETVPLDECYLLAASIHLPVGPPPKQNIHVFHVHRQLTNPPYGLDLNLHPQEIDILQKLFAMEKEMMTPTRSGPVYLYNLQSRADLNNQVGVVQHALPDERVAVRLETGEDVSVAIKNVLFLEDISGFGDYVAGVGFTGGQRKGHQYIICRIHAIAKTRAAMLYAMATEMLNQQKNYDLVYMAAMNFDISGDRARAIIRRVDLSH